MLHDRPSHGQLYVRRDINKTQLADVVGHTITGFKDDAEVALEAFKGDKLISTMNIDLTNVSLPSSEDFDYQLQFQFGLYMKLGTTLSAKSKYTYNLLTYSPPYLGLDETFTLALSLLWTSSSTLAKKSLLTVECISRPTEVLSTSACSTMKSVTSPCETSLLSKIAYGLTTSS